MKQSIVSLLLLLISVMGFSQTGTVKGRLTSFEANKVIEIPFVTIWAIEANVGTRSGINGTYSLSLPVGKNTIIYRPDNLLKDTLIIFIKDNEVLELNVDLKPKTLGVVTITRKSTSNKASVISTVRETKESDVVATITSSSQIEEKGDSDVGSGAKKMTGMSTVGDVLYVRGLGDRYNVAYLNGLPIPSPNPDYRVVPLAIFPTDVVRSVSVSKVMSADVYGDFAGGAFNILTKSYLEKPTLSISIGSGGNTQTTFQNFKTYTGGKTDYFGLDDGTRNLSTFVINNSKQASYSAINSIYPNSYYNSVEGKSTGFLDNFGTKFQKAMPNSSFSIMGGNFYEFPKSVSSSSGIGFLALLNHDFKYTASNGSIKLINAQSEERLNYNISKYNINTTSTGLFSVYLRATPDHNITFNTLFVNTSNDETRDTWGNHFDYAQDIYSSRLTYKQNFISVNQIIGTHQFLKPKKDEDFSKLTLDWRGSYNITGSKEPDRRQVVLFYDDIDKTENYSFNYIDKNENHRFYSQLKENEVAGKVNIKYIAKVKTNFDNTVERPEPLITINGGLDYKLKNRNFDYKQYNYILNTLASSIGNNVDMNNMNAYLNSVEHDSSKFYIQEVSNFGSSYKAELSVFGSYLSAKFKLKKLELIPGLRYEISNQTVINRNQQSPSIIEKTTNNNNNLLPSLIAKYTANDNNIFRMVMSQTVTRPKFNELAPFQYTLFFAGMKAEGNPELNNGTNYNFDLRYEHYLRPGEMITLGAFYKYLDAPIEQTMKATASGQLMSFSNALSAQVGGVEVEFIRNLSFLIKDEVKRDSSLLKHFGLGINATYMYTAVNIDTLDQSSINTNVIRPLEGASPFLLNFDLRYETKFNDNKNKLLVAGSYNVFGQRLVTVGSNGIGDSYALPVNTLNFVSKLSFDNNLSIGFKVKNILNPSIAIVQEDKVNLGEFIKVSDLKNGIDFSFSIGYKFDYKKSKH